MSVSYLEVPHNDLSLQNPVEKLNLQMSENFDSAYMKALPACIKFNKLNGSTEEAMQLLTDQSFNLFSHGINRYILKGHKLFCRAQSSREDIPIHINLSNQHWIGTASNPTITLPENIKRLFKAIQGSDAQYAAIFYEAIIGAMYQFYADMIGARNQSGYVQFIDCNRGFSTYIDIDSMLSDSAIIC